MDSNLANTELDAAVAEKIIGSTIIEATPGDPVCYLEHWSGDVDATHGIFVSIGTTSRRGTRMGQHVPAYSTDHNACQLVRAVIESLGLRNEFMEHLQDLVDVWPSLSLNWRILNATPEQQCRAALKAVSR